VLFFLREKGPFVIPKTVRPRGREDAVVKKKSKLKYLKKVIAHFKAGR
jgi:hypothetical protein